MRRLTIFISVGFVTLLGEAGESQLQAGTNGPQLPTFSLTDQHSQPHVFTFPQPSVSVVTVADRKGAEQIEPWVRAVTTRYATNVLIEGVADVSSVPAPLRSLIRKRFRAAFAHSVMLDWKGWVVAQLQPVPDVANVYAVNTNGVVLRQFSGPANPNNLAELFAVLDANRALAATNVLSVKSSSAP